MIYRILTYSLLIVVALFVLFPFFWMINTSLKPEGTVLSLSMLPERATLQNFYRVLTQYSFGKYFANSMIVAFTAAFLSTLFASLAAYSFAKRDFFMKRVLYMVFLSSMMIPGLMYMVPQFALVSKLGWINTYPAMIVPHLANVFGFLLMIQFIRTLPNSLFEAARIDGASEWKIFMRIVVPLSTPIIATLFLLSFQFHWNNFLWQLIVTTKEAMYTVPVGLAMFRSAYEEQYALKMAASSISIIPIAIVFLFTQRFFIEGMTKGAVKG
jgi:multiple sugar transport system permease protein